MISASASLFTNAHSNGPRKCRNFSTTCSQTIQSIIDEIKPEAVYFIADAGKRTAVFIVDMQDMSQLPAVAEPWFLAFNADLNAVPAMLGEDLAKAGPAIEAAGKKFG